MIGTLDTITLARTKLQSKRILLIITIIISGLLFSVLSAAVFISTGISKSVSTYFTSSLGSQYLVDVAPHIPLSVISPGYAEGNNGTLSPQQITQLTAIQDTYVANQKAIYKQFNLPFESSSIAPILKPDPFGRKDSTGTVIQVIDWQSPIYADYAKQVLQDYLKTDHGNTDGDLKRIATSAGATGVYPTDTTWSMSNTAQYLQDGKEDVTKYNSPNSPYQDQIADSIKGSVYTFLDQSILQRYILPTDTSREQNTTAIPVILSTDAIVKTFGKHLDISKKPSTPAEQISWMKSIQQKMNGYTYTVCYRSPGEIAQLKQIMQTNATIAQHSSDKTYQAPNLQYNLPTTPCGDITVKQDKRTVQEKKNDTTQEALEKALGTYQPLSHQLLTFQVIGVASISDIYSMASDIQSDPVAYLSSLLGATYQNGAFIPQQLYDNLPTSNQHKDIMQTSSEQNPTYGRTPGLSENIVSFPTIQAARNFINSYCQPSDENCTKPFVAQPYASNYLLIDSFSRLITKAARIALPIAVTIAAIIIWITMARVIIDSRRETAVFRAIGAKRRDIASIYLVYSMMVALLITIFMLALGFIIALVINHLYGPQATDIAKVAYGSFDNVQPFSFVRVNLLLLGALVLCIFAVSFAATIPPLIRNVRRSPIRDMRDDG